MDEFYFVWCYGTKNQEWQNFNSPAQRQACQPQTLQLYDDTFLPLYNV